LIKSHPQTYFLDFEEHFPKKSTRADYETALEATGYGKFHYWLLVVCGWANAADAVEIL